MVIKHEIDKTDSGKNIKYILIKRLGMSSGLIKKLKKESRIFLNEIPSSVINIVSKGDIVSADVTCYEKSSSIQPENIPVDVLFEDSFFIILNKPSSMLVHPVTNENSGTLSNALRFYQERKNESYAIRPVSRLDRNTSGIIVFAKNAYAQNILIKQMVDNTFIKKYTAVVNGHFKNKEGTINLPVKRKENSIIERTVSKDGKNAATYYKVIDEFKNASLLDIRILTGRTHQIRVHMSYTGHPVIGDTLYGKNTYDSSYIKRQALHSSEISFYHMIRKEKINIAVSIPQDIIDLIKKLS